MALTTIPTNFLTFVTAIPGGKAHTKLQELSKSIFCIKYKVNADSYKVPLFDNFPNHSTYIIEGGKYDGMKIPRVGVGRQIVYDRAGLTEDEYNIKAIKKLSLISQEYDDKQIISVSHLSPKKLREDYPDSTIHFIEVDEEDINECNDSIDLLVSVHWGDQPQSDHEHWREQAAIHRAEADYADHVYNYKDIR